MTRRPCYPRPMNAPLTTRAGEGFDRRAWTVRDLFALMDAGLMEGGEPFELIEGELLAMSPKQNRHEVWKRTMTRFLYRNLGDAYAIAIEPTLFLDERSAPEPDILVHPAGILPADVRGPDVLLLVEVTDSSQHRDLVLKAALYARHGVAHYWVLDAERRRIVTHARPGGDGYGLIETHGMEALLPLPFRPDVVLAPAELDRF